ncbi:MAG: hypothetical protein GX430_06295 [Treponema sp.]|nr:hypothetical protein [Treponema sp.]
MDKIEIVKGVPTYLGSCPGRKDPARQVFHRLETLGVQAIVNLLSEDDYGKHGSPVKQDYASLFLDSGIRDLLRFPIRDYEIPRGLEDFSRFVEMVHFRISAGDILFIHCGAGLGRTGTLAAALVIRERGLISTRAVELVRAARPGSVETPEQFEFLERYARSLAERAG